MKTALTNLRWPAIISQFLVLLFAVIELVNRRNFDENFPIPLFGIL